MRFSIRNVVSLLPLILLIAAEPALAALVWPSLGPYGGEEVDDGIFKNTLHPGHRDQSERRA
jgi:hypothetical protein